MDKELNKKLKEWKKFDKKKNKSSDYKNNNKNKIKIADEILIKKRIKNSTMLFNDSDYLESYLLYTENKKPYNKFIKKQEVCKSSIKNLYFCWAKSNIQNLIIWILCIIFIIFIFIFTYKFFTQKN